AHGRVVDALEHVVTQPGEVGGRSVGVGVRGGGRYQTGQGVVFEVQHTVHDPGRVPPPLDGPAGGQVAGPVPAGGVHDHRAGAHGGQVGAGDHRRGGVGGDEDGTDDQVCGGEQGGEAVRGVDLHTHPGGHTADVGGGAVGGAGQDGDAGPQSGGCGGGCRSH